MEDRTRALPSLTTRPRKPFIRARLGLSPLPRLRTALGTLVVLFKLRVVVLLVLASIGGAMLASGGRPAAGDLLLLLVTGILSSAGASAVNQYLERSRDARMERTCRRPLAAGQWTRPELALGAGVGLILLAVVIALPFNRSLALFLTLGALIYIGIYTLWLKPRTLLNIVIGGAAGSCAVLSGSAAVGDWAHPTAIGLALLVFVWTPIHFWSLSQAYRDDYGRTSVPMLPVLVSDRASAQWIALHTGATAWIALLLGVDPALGWSYWLLAFPATLWLGFHSVRLIAVPNQTRALRLFKVSNMYLGLVLLAIYAGTLF